MKRSSSALAVALALGASACASAKLELELAIYREDPGRFLLAAEEARDLQGDLQQAKEEASKVVERRIELARRASELYDDAMVVLTVGQAPVEEQVAAEADARAQLSSSGPKLFLPDHEILARKAGAEAEKAIQRAAALLEGYVRKISSYEATREELRARAAQGPAGGSGTATEEDLRQERQQLLLTSERISAALGEVSSRLDRLTESLGSDYEEWFRGSWPLIGSVLEPESLRQYLSSSDEPTAVAELRESLEAFEAELEEHEKQGVRVRSEVRGALEFQTLRNDPSASFAKLAELAKLASPSEADLSMGGEVAFHAVRSARQLLYSQIDRLQDAADPVWRILSDPANKALWNTEFVDTYFYAEGNTAVVVVRDTPIQYRVQRAENNPTALVQAQLEVSRAVGEAALSVAAATTGADLAPMAGAREGPPTDAGTADAERLAQRRAEVEERGRIRRAIAQGLLRDLTELRAQAENLDPAKEASWTALRELREQLLSGLQSRKMLLEKSGSTED